MIIFTGFLTLLVFAALCFFNAFAVPEFVTFIVIGSYAIILAVAWLVWYIVDGRYYW